MTNDSQVWCECGHRRKLHSKETETRVNAAGNPEVIEFPCLVIYHENPDDRCGCRGFKPGKTLNETG
jgi:hypothetical protein